MAGCAEMLLRATLIFFPDHIHFWSVLIFLHGPPALAPSSIELRPPSLALSASSITTPRLSPELSTHHNSPPNLPLQPIHPNELSIPQPSLEPHQGPLAINRPPQHSRLSLEKVHKFPKPNPLVVLQREMPSSPRTVLIPNPERDLFLRRLGEKYLPRKGVGGAEEEPFGRHVEGCAGF